MENTFSIRLQNRERVRSAFRFSPSTTKPELAAATGLSTVTIGAIISEMEADGEVIRGALAPSCGGRPSITYSYNSSYRCAAAAYIYGAQGKNWASFSVSDLFGNLLFSNQREILTNADLSTFERTIDLLFEKYPNISTLAVSFPGVEQADGQIAPGVGQTDSLTRGFLNPVEILPRLRQRYAVPILFENDINAAIFGWYQTHTANRGNTVGLYFPRTVPPGAGIILDGKLYHGFHSFAGEFASIPTPISWFSLDYSDEALLEQMVGTSMVTFCCTIAPAHLVLYGDFWTDTLKCRLMDTLPNTIGTFFSPTISFSTDIHPDFQRGVMELALAELRNRLAAGIS